MSSATHELVDLGPEQSIGTLPARVLLRGKPYFLTRQHAEYRLLSTTCPHQGGEVVDAGSCLECPHHGWRFDRVTGSCLNTPNQRLSFIPVSVREGRLVVDLPAARVVSGRSAVGAKPVDQLTIQLHAHACLEIVHAGFSVLTDPWLSGPAFYGAWMHYPPLVVNVATLSPNAIVITHEHPDHFHEATLRHFDRSIPIFFPDFPNRRIGTRLKHLGFVNAHPLGFGETARLSADITVTYFEPESLWNDAIALIDVQGFRILNINDAGLNHRIAAQVTPVDVVAAQFSTGASGYPLTWNHVTDDMKRQIMDRGCQGKLRMLQEAMELYGGRYLLPFASHFALWHPSHREYVRLRRKNTMDDVVATFEGSDVRVVDLLAGESWEVSTDTISRVWPDRGKLYDRDQVIEHLERSFDPVEFAAHHPTSEDLTYAELASYFLRLNSTPEVTFCEDLTVTVRGMGGAAGGTVVEIAFEVAHGELRLLDAAPVVPNLLIEIPCGLLKHTVANNMSWDDATIGYWCRFTRNPDAYHAGFWRLLQAPYFNKTAGLRPSGQYQITDATVVADLVERHGAEAERVLGRYGLYCVGCHHSTHDTIAQGARQHGIRPADVERLVRELNRVLTPWASARPQAATPDAGAMWAGAK